jgi:hypothetical protein
LEWPLSAKQKNKRGENLPMLNKPCPSYFFSDSEGAESTIFYKIDALIELLTPSQK